VGLDSPDMSDNGANRNVGLNPIYGTVRVAQDRDLADTEHRRGSSQFRFTDAPDLNRIAALSRRLEATAFSARGRDEVRLDPLGCVLCERAAETQRAAILRTTKN